MSVYRWCSENCVILQKDRYGNMSYRLGVYGVNPCSRICFLRCLSAMQDKTHGKEALGIIFPARCDPELPYTFLSRAKARQVFKKWMQHEKK